MEKIYFNNGSPTVTISWTLREKGGAVVDFTDVTTKLWITGNGDKVLVDSSASSGVVTATVPTTLTAGVYGLAIKWLDGWTCCKEEVEKAFEVVSTSGAATITDTATLTYDSIISKCDYDDLPDYEKQVLRGNTSKSESGWLGSSSGSYTDLTDKPTKVSDFENDVPFAALTSGATADRPVGKHEVEGEVVGDLDPTTDIGFCYYDTTLGIPIFASAIDDTTGDVTWKTAAGGDPDE